MTMTDLNNLTMNDWLISLWPVYLIILGIACGLIARWLRH